MRILGYILGAYMLANGLLTATLPRWWTDTSVRATERILPPEQAGVMEEFTRLSPAALRYAGVVETALALTVLGLASRITGRMRRPA